MTRDWLEQLAYGQLNLDPVTFGRMLPRQFWNKLIGWRRLKDAEGREELERTRWLAYQILLPHVDREKEFKVTDVIRFPWDDKPDEVKRPEPNRERFELMKQRFANV